MVWLSNPYAALLVLGALHLWLLLVSPRTRPPRPAALALVALALVPLALLIAFYARELGVGPGGVAWDAVLLLAGGHIGVAATVLWSLGVRLRGGRRAARDGARSGARRRRDRRRHAAADPRAAVLCRAGIARRYRVGAATLSRPRSRPRVDRGRNG